MRRLFAPLCAGGALVLGASSAMAEVTLPSIGITSTEYVSAAGTEIGTALAAIFGLFVVVMVIFGTMRWLKRVRSA